MFYFGLLILLFFIIFVFSVYYINIPEDRKCVNEIGYNILKDKPKIFCNNEAKKFENLLNSTKSIEESAREVFRNYTCPKCGGAIIEGQGVIIKFKVIYLFKDTLDKKMFFTIRKSKRYKRVFDLDKIYVRKGTPKNMPGYVKCKCCTWNITANHLADQVWLKKADLESLSKVS